MIRIPVHKERKVGEGQWIVFDPINGVVYNVRDTMDGILSNLYKSIYPNWDGSTVDIKISNIEGEFLNNKAMTIKGLPYVIIEIYNDKWNEIN